MKILFLGDVQHPNSKNWISALEKYGNCEVVTWSLPWPHGTLGHLKRLNAWFLAAISVKKLIKREKPDMVIGYRLTSYGFIAALSNHPVIVIAAQGNSDVHSTEKTNFLNTFLKKQIAKFAVKKASLIHAWSENMAENIYSLDAPQKKVLILHRGIDLKNFIAIEKKSFDTLELIVTRALYKEYCHPVILRAMKKTIEKGIPVTLKIIGIGVEEENLKHLIKDLRIETHVKFYGQLNNIELKEELNKSNVYVSMPTTEGLSSSLIEGMACKCIPVVSDLNANSIWIKNNDNGFLVPINDIDNLAEVFEYIWKHKNSFDDVLERNIKIVQEKSSQEVNTQIFISHYTQLINQAKLCVE